MHRTPTMLGRQSELCQGVQSALAIAGQHRRPGGPESAAAAVRRLTDGIDRNISDAELADGPERSARNALVSVTHRPAQRVTGVNTMDGTRCDRDRTSEW